MQRKNINRVAIIDCGTNTFHLLIAETGAGTIPVTLFRTKSVVKLGEGGIAGKIILKKPFERGIKALVDFSHYIRKYKAEKTLAYATAAMRTASNAGDFLQEAYSSAGIKIEVINGSREALLIYHGVKNSLDLGEKPVLIMDIGGGSVEFIIGNRNKIFWKKSFKLGAAFLLDLFHPSDPLAKAEKEQINNYLKEKLQPLFVQCKKFSPVTLIGASGSFETFVQMLRVEKGLNPGIKKISDEISMSGYMKLQRRLLKSTTGDRKNMKGLVKMRVDMIVTASMLLTFVLRQAGIKRMRFSAYALKEGMLFDVAKKNN